MKKIRKILMVSVTALTLGTVVSCNKGSTFKAGSPYTIITFDNVQGNVRFDCVGDPVVYWNNLETASSEKSHRFNEMEDAYVVISGNISKLWFCNENGEPLEIANNKIVAVTLSNTITDIPKNAFGSMSLDMAYIPSSVQTVGENAFFPLNPSEFYCEATSRPNGWADNWCTVKDFSRLVKWGFSYYVTEDGMLFTLFNDNNSRSAYYEGNLYFKSASLPNIEIPENIDVNGTSLQVVGVESAGYVVNDAIETITLPKTVTYISSGAFNGCRKLKEVKFAEHYNNLYIGKEVFNACEELESIILPEGLTKISESLFVTCPKLNYVKIPSSVKAVGASVFLFCGGYVTEEDGLTIDLTAYNDMNSIAACDKELLNACFVSSRKDSGGIIFKINSGLNETDFTKKGWPEAYNPGEEGDYRMRVVWEKVS